MDWPVEGPHPWMWYYYDQRRTYMTSWIERKFSGEITGFYGHSNRSSYIHGMGRNPAQAIKDYHRKLLLAKQRRIVL